MEILIYIITFIIGTFFGSFFTLAVYRIPRKEDILIKHSYCPNCNHKLGFFDLFPVFSYIFLNGQCRYCKNKIRPRYLILELLSGFTFFITVISLKINIFDLSSIIQVIFLLIYISILFIIAGIDKENIKVEKNVLLFGYIIEILYMIYLYTLGNFSVYQYVIYTILFLIIFIMYKTKVNEYSKYITLCLSLSLYMLICVKIKLYILTIILAYILGIIYNKILKERQIPIAYCLAISNILIIIFSNILVNYII